MWLSDQRRSDLSLLGLVASDFAYKRKAEISFDLSDPSSGDFLTSFPDSRSEDEYQFPRDVEGTSSDPTAFNFVTHATTQKIGVATYGNWNVYNVLENDGTGFGVVIFRGTYLEEGRQRTDYLVAFRGTDGRDGQDWYSNVQLGTNQWFAEVQPLIDQLEALRNADETPFLGTIHFTGQSLGGGLAQYAAYEFVKRRKELALTDPAQPFDSASVTLTTFNAFAGGAGLERIYGDQVDSNLLSGISTAHYSIANDVVHALGAAPGTALGHVNAFDGGVSNLYHFDFRAVDENGQLKQGEQSFLGLVEGHRIESGFYAGLARYETSFADAAPRAEISYADVGDLQQLAEVFARVLGGDRTNTVSAWSRVAVGGLMAGLLSKPGQFQAVLDLLADSLYKSDDIGAFTRGFIKSGIPNLLLKVFAFPVIKVAGAGLFIASLADLMDKKSEAGQSVDYANTFLPGESAAAEIPLADEAHNDRASAVRFNIALAAINPEAIGQAHLQEIAPALQSLDLNLDDFGAVLYGGGDWAYNTLHHLHTVASQKGISDQALAAFDAHAVGFVAGQIAAVGAGDGAFTATAHAQLLDFVREDLGWALANANSDFRSPYQIATNAFAATVTDFQDYSAVEGALRAALEDPSFAVVHSLIEEALGISHAAWQTVVVGEGREANPFDVAGFDPDAYAAPMIDLRDGSLATLSVYLPYEAGAGGQDVLLKLSGNLAEQLTVLLAGEELRPDANGGFAVIVAEGQREATVSIVASTDVDVDQTMQVTAQIADASGVATHEPREVAKIAVLGEAETPPLGGREIRGDWAPKAYTNPETGETGFRSDDLGNIERDPGVPNTMGYQPPASFLNGSSGGDHIVTGDYMDTVLARTGDDHITGSDVWGTVVYAGAGNDWVEALLYTDYEEDYFEFERHGRLIRLGEDVLYGGPGDDRLYGESEATVTTLYDESAPATGRPGDWTSGGTGNDWIYGGAGDDVLMGGLGEDHLLGGAGMDVMLGDDQFVNATAALYWTVLHPNFGDSMSGFADFELGLFPVYNYYPNLVVDPGGTDGLIEDPYITYYKAGGGADVLMGGAGKDILIGQLGDDTLYGGSDDDVLAGWEGADRIYGGEGNDRIAGEFGRYERPFQRIAPDLEVGIAGLLGAPSFDGSTVDQIGDDLIGAGAGDDVVFGEGGDDVILGGDGADTLYGDAEYLPEHLHGNDLLDGGAGDDRLFGNAGADRLLGGVGDDMLSGGSGEDVLEGGAGQDVLEGGEGVDTVQGGAGDDRLEGGDDDDTLFGESGADALSGGAGNDRLYGNAGDDVLSGGDGNDVLDGGTGDDVLRGGPGDDVFFVSPGYGADVIEDPEGQSHIRFGADVLPDQIRADLEASTQLAVLSFGLPGETLTVMMNQFDLGAVHFADGTTWSRRQFVNVIPALASEGGESNDVLIGHAGLRNELRGMAGDDFLQGSRNDDLLEGGEGADVLDGGVGADRFVYRLDETGVDVLSDSGVATGVYLEWFYSRRGIADWHERATHGGQYRAGDGFAAYFPSYEAAYAAFPGTEIAYVAPLDETAPIVGRNDADALAELATAGVLDLDVVEFGAGIAVEDLGLWVTVDALLAAQKPEQPWHGGGTLSVRWENAGFDLLVPDSQFGLGTSDGGWNDYRLGEGVEAFRFADGSLLSLEDLLQHASVIPRLAPYEFFRESGEQLVSREHEAIAFQDAIRSDEVQISREGLDLIVSAAGSHARVTGWYTDPARMPTMTLRFQFDADVGAHALTQAGLSLLGSEEGDDLVGLDAFDDRIEGGLGNDTLDGRGGKDVYVFEYGDGLDTILEAPAGAEDPEASVIAFGPGVHIWRFEVAAESLVIHYGESDAIRFTAFDPSDPRATPVFERLEFAADGNVIFLNEYLDYGFLLNGTDGDDVVQGTALGDTVHGGGGNDILAGGKGDDFLYGDAGSDVYAYSSGDGRDEIYDGGQSPDDRDTLRFDGSISPEDVRVASDFNSLYLLIGAGADRVVFVGALDDPGGRIERVEFTDGSAWTPEDLYARIEPGTGTEFDDLLYGTEGRDVFEGLAGADDLSGLGGDDLLLGGAGDDYIDGGEGNDILRGGNGSDYLIGGAGHDLVEGGAGDDYLNMQGNGVAIGGAGSDWIDNYGAGTVVAFNSGDDEDTVYVADAFTLSLGGGIRPEDLALHAEGGDLVLTISDTDAIRLTRRFEPDAQAWPQITLQLFGSVHFYDFNAAIAAYRAAAPGNEPFALGEVLAAHHTGSSAEAAYGGGLAYRYATTGSVSAFTSDQVFLLLGQENFGATVHPIVAEVGNQAPMLANPIGDQQASEDALFQFVVPNDAFADPDAGALTYAAVNLPAWLSFDAETRTFLGTPLQGDVRATEVQLVATDEAGLSAEDSFVVAVANVNDAPVLVQPIAAQSAVEDQPFSFSAPADTFLDEDPSDVLAWFAAGVDGAPLPGWLSFDAATRTFSGKPGNPDVGSLALSTTALDVAGASASASFTVTVSNVNDAPALMMPLPLQSFEAGSQFTFSVPAATFTDEDAGDSLQLSARLLGGEALPAWLAFDPATNTFSGSPGKQLNGKWEVLLTATDGAGATASTDLDLIIYARAGATVRGGKGDDFLYGGSGQEVLIGKGGSDMLQGNGGNDLLLTGSGADVVVFNRGDGTDTVIADRFADNTLSLGGGITYGDLSLSRQGKNLVVNTGGDDRIILKNWYAGKQSVLNLQIVLDASDEFDAGSPDDGYRRKVQTFDFRGLVSTFDDARRASPGLTSWDLTNALLQFHLAGAGANALGSDLAGWYAKRRGSNGVSLAAAQQAIGAPGFASEAQSLRPFAGLEEGFVKLS